MTILTGKEAVQAGRCFDDGDDDDEDKEDGEQVTLVDRFQDLLSSMV